MKPSTKLALTLGSTGALLVLLARVLSARATLALAPLSLVLHEPRALYLLALTPLLGWIAAHSRAPLSRTRRGLSLGLRALLLASLTLALARPVAEKPLRRTSTVFVVDVSESVDDGALARAHAYLARARAARGSHHVELVTFARQARRVPLPADGTAPLVRHEDGGASDLERGLSLALGLLAPDCAPQIVLFSDLRETAGAAARALARLAQREVRLFVAVPEDARQAEMFVQSLTLPRELRVGEVFELEAELFSQTPGRAHVRLLQDGADNPLDAQRELVLPAGSTTVSFRTLARRAGKVHYRVELTPAGADRFAENNHFERATTVRGPPRVLYVERTREQAEPLAALLRGAGFEVEVRVGEAAPRSAAELQEVAFYILSDVAAATLTPAGMQAIEGYLREGGGFLMAGGEHTFSAGGYAGTALEPLLPVSLAGSLRREQPSVALMLVIDKSGSMAGDKLERAKEAAIATAELLGAHQYLGVIGFDAQPVRVVPLAVANQRASTTRRLSTLSAGGGTALFPALDAAYAELVGVRARVKHVVLLTDGQSEEAALDELVRSMQLDGITVSTVGLGDDVNRGLLRALAHAGRGRAYFTRDPARIPRLFAEETELIAHAPLREQRLMAREVSRADFLRGIDLELAPPLRGIVTTRARGAPAQLVLTTHDGDPLLARMRVGRGWSLAFTSDVKSRWSADWYRWRQLSALFAQLIREHMRREPSRVLPIRTRLGGNTLHATVDVLSEQERFVNGLGGELRSTAPSGRVSSLPLVQTAPGRYGAELALDTLGSYLLEAHLARPDGELFIARGDAAYSYPAEYALEPLARGGSLVTLARSEALPPPGRLFEPARSPLRRREPRWPPLLWLALSAFLLDLVLRRGWPRGRSLPTNT